MAKKKKDEVLITADKRGVVTLLIAAVVLAVLWFMWAGPVREENRTAEQGHSAAQQQLSEKSTKLAALKSGEQRSATQLLARSRALDGYLPQQLDPVSVATAVERLASGRGLTLNSMTPAAPVNGAGAPAGTTVQTFTMDVSGSPQALVGMLQELQRMSPLMVVSGANFTDSAASSSSTSGGAGAKLTATLTTYSVSSAQVDQLRQTPVPGTTAPGTQPGTQPGTMGSPSGSTGQ